MEESISTSVSTVRTLHQSHGDKDLDSQTFQVHREREHHASPPTHATPNVAGLPESLQDNEVLHNWSPGLSTANVAVGPSVPSSPHMHALVLPSPPDSPGPSRSPSIDSVSESSLPSVSSSFFFSSSAPGSPGRSHPGSYPSSHPHSDHGHDHDHEQDDEQGKLHTRFGEHGLIIPSLTLPDALRRPTPFGQTLGNLKVLVLGGQGAGKSFLTGLLLEDNEDVVDVGTWEDWNGGSDSYGKVLRASTDWVEQRDVFGLERYEPTRNVEIVELPGYSHDADVNELITRLKAVIETPFRALHDALHPEGQPSTIIANMLAAPTSPLYTAMVLVHAAPTPLDKEIILALSTHVPLIVLPRLHGPHRGLAAAGSASSARLSNFRPASAVALRSGLFHSPETVALLRSEAVDRFLRWREVERAVEGIWDGREQQQRDKETTKGTGSGSFWWGSGVSVAGRLPQRGDSLYLEDEEEETKTREGKSVERWSKAKWEAEWMENHSHDVAIRMREDADKDQMRRRRRRTISSKPIAYYHSEHNRDDSSKVPPPLDKPPVQPQPQPHGESRGLPHTSFDPLHLPSLLMFSFSLLGPLRTRVGDSIRGFVEIFGDTRVQFALTGGFCVGLGLGAWAKAW
ncbi:hypothetical protein CVT25_011690 [Psilocybe cyanescens]|uniref:Septin-type G domain-containing protein n=1 Tax=Psilocybe cyanescens TaxID=93625 RepID=A0A409WIJ5_PSICY|nr:hypothetical protein CVT25_011690 [Psilocybe cyanescens]